MYPSAGSNPAIPTPTKWGKMKTRKVTTAQGRIFLVCTTCTHWVGNGEKANVCDCECHRPSMVREEALTNWLEWLDNAGE